MGKNENFLLFCKLLSNQKYIVIELQYVVAAGAINWYFGENFVFKKLASKVKKGHTQAIIWSDSVDKWGL
jgi:hypothetical protein